MILINAAGHDFVFELDYKLFIFATFKGVKFKLIISLFIVLVNFKND